MSDLKSKQFDIFFFFASQGPSRVLSDFGNLLHILGLEHGFNCYITKVAK